MGESDESFREDSSMNLTRDLLKSFLLQACSVLVRLLLTSWGSHLIEKGLVSDNQWSAFLIGLATVLATLGWSLAEKYDLFRYLGLALESEKGTTFTEIKGGK